MTHQEIIECIEGDGKIMEYRIEYDNLPVWPLIRNHVLDAVETYIYDGRFIVHEEKVTFDKRIKNKVNRAFFLAKICLKSKLFNRGKLRNRTVLMFPNRNYMRDGRVHENIFGHFIADRDSTLLIKYYDDKYRWFEAEADAIFREGIYSLNYIIDDLIGKRNNKCDRDTGKEIANYISKKVGIIDSNVSEFIEERVGYLSSLVKQRERVLEWICNKTSPKYVILSEAVYSYFAAECHYFNKKRIPVIEIEHAMIHEGHRAYYFADAIFNNKEYKLFLPNMLAVWSDYCENAAHVNTRIEVVGNPEFYYSYSNDFLKSKKEIKDDSKRKFLYNLNLPIEKLDKAIAFIEDFSLKSDEESILIIRFHPLYRDLMECFEKFKNMSNIVFDDSEGFYSALGKCDFLISNFSTVVYEALACGIRVFTDDIESFTDTNLLDELEEFDSIEDLFFKVNKPQQEKKNVDYKQLFFGNDKNKYNLWNIYSVNNQEEL